MDSGDKNWAQEYLNDPLHAPQPSEETGPGSTINRIAKPTSPTTGKRLSKTNPYRQESLSSKAPTATASEVGNGPTPGMSPQQTRDSNNPFRQSSTSSKGPNTSSNEVLTDRTKRNSYPSPPHSASPKQEKFPGMQTTHRHEAFSDHKDGSPTSSGRPRRTSSLSQRYPGDKSHMPLKQLEAENRAADRAPHLHKKHQIGPDTIDTLDSASGPYHHEGPYDATMFARNTSYKSSPVAATSSTTRETLRATPKEKIMDSLEGHRPLDGVAAYQPGEVDRNGHVYDYEQGENMMTDNAPEGGAYKRWPGVQYHPDDIKGKGEPSYSIEKALKEHNSDQSRQGRQQSGSQEIEMTAPKSRTSTGRDSLGGGTGVDGKFDPQNPMWGDGEQGRFMRSASARDSKRNSGSGGGLKHRFGSIKNKVKDVQILP